jgi:hypothetical protein
VVSAKDLKPFRVSVLRNIRKSNLVGGATADVHRQPQSAKQHRPTPDPALLE